MKHKECKICEVRADVLATMNMRLNDGGYCPICAKVTAELPEIAEANRVPRKEYTGNFTTTLDEFVF